MPGLPVGNVLLDQFRCGQRLETLEAKSLNDFEALHDFLGVLSSEVPLNCPHKSFLVLLDRLLVQRENGLAHLLDKRVEISQTVEVGALGLDVLQVAFSKAAQEVPFDEDLVEFVPHVDVLIDRLCRLKQISNVGIRARQSYASVHF